jgi:hypothetical protein
LPELVDPDLRPVPIQDYVVDADGERLAIPAVPGLTHADDAYDKGYRAGFGVGQLKAEAEQDDNCGWPVSDGEQLPRETTEALRVYPGKARS